MAKATKQSIYRILDANINRAAEGMRVCEEVMRFILNDRASTKIFKDMRHRIFKIFDRTRQNIFIAQRNVNHDTGKNIFRGELKRDNYQHIFFANLQRVKESIRVLEEFSKLINIKQARQLKEIRYHVYELEKKIAFKFADLSGIRQKFLRKTRLY